MKKKISVLVAEMEEVLTNNILPYWMNKMVDEVNGGFYGRITGTEELIPEAEKGAILNARILWTYSAAYRLLHRDEYLHMATRAKRTIIDSFYDKEFGGIYWSLDYKGNPLDSKKQIYAIGFAIYGLSEYYRATLDTEGFTYAIHLFESIEKYSFDTNKNGYCEALTREWAEMADMRLSDKDANERKTMNTHLHILEPYTNLYRVWKDERLEQQLRNLIYLFTDKILDKDTHHLQLFFNDDWENKYNIISCGHDIEASWLIHEAALELGDKALLATVEPLVQQIARAATEGFTPGAGMIYERNLDNAHLDADRHWWVQAETVVGYLNIYQHFGDEEALSKAVDCWTFIKSHLIDRENGEWYWSIRADGTVNREDDKAGFWKCPYHNGRMCLEVMERFKE
ncbi:AGE family epimerase/isomerase [uncultured Bacteroides sp.]|uniref:AGE family epimerase/isomerase n=1 Tax=uncultured Bacteroides sp. TaxID=162156 RepID=UPI002AAB144B|nr:AGE family epimerase/isomerase [uncultured Bacteroides sp.]